jgi:uncharacterized membrane protein
MNEKQEEIWKGMDNLSTYHFLSRYTNAGLNPSVAVVRTGKLAA